MMAIAVALFTPGATPVMTPKPKVRGNCGQFSEENRVESRQQSPIFLHRMIFAYWQQADEAPIADFLDHWRQQFPDFKLLKDRDIEPLFELHMPERLATYQAIRIPAAKADVARLIALYEYGGLYVDCHCAVRDEQALKALLGKHEVCVIDKNAKVKAAQGRESGELFPLNTVIFAQARSPIILAALRQATFRLARKQRVEKLSGMERYSIWELSGPGVLAEVFIEPGSDGKRIRSEYRGRLAFIKEEEAPVVRNGFTGYRIPGQHWSDRSKTELLFDH